MCGITGYVGGSSAVDTALENLKRLEYRGYDSAGVAFPNCTQIEIVRSVGKIASLEQALAGRPHEARAAIAHTRWATHGGPTEANAHPHRDCTGRIAVVHNGIIENHAALRAELREAGHQFTSQTDTEVIAHLIEAELAKRANVAASDPAGIAAVTAEAVRAALSRLSGAYAVAVISQDVPDTLFVSRKDSPLVLGLGEGENYLASDIPAVLRHTRRVILLQDGDFAVLTPSAVSITDSGGRPATRPIEEIGWDDQAAEKSGYPHFMLKEIHEGARTVANTLRGRLAEDSGVHLNLAGISAAQWRAVERVSLIGCGTAYHAGVVGKRIIEQLLRWPTEVSMASEFRYGDPLVGPGTLAVFISQSGETADTLAALREAKAKGATTLAVVNVMGSTLAREADATLLTQAGPEIGVASTKAYLAQLTALALLAISLAQTQGRDVDSRLLSDLRRLPELLSDCLSREQEVARLAKSVAGSATFFYLGRGYDYAVALEAALKLKEISYLHAEAYAAGEMKHGPLALVEPGVVVIGLCTQAATQEKMLSNLEEIKARGGTVIAVVPDGEEEPPSADATVRVPAAADALMPILAMVPMQLLAYHIARERGCEIDQPRNLAKSVTVE